jgi:hypothetical protein
MTETQPARSFSAFLRECTPLPPELFDRMSVLEAGRHPSLDELRRAFGLCIDLSRCSGAALDLRESSSDAELARIVDAMYGAIASPRAISVEITAEAVVPSRDAAPVVVRDEERLVLYVVASNRTDAGVRFSAEAHGEGIGGYIEAQRAGSVLFDTGHMHPGAYLLPVMIVADGRPATIDVPIECRPSGVLRVSIVDDETGEPIAARVYLRDDIGDVWPQEAVVRRDVHGHAWFHVDGGFEARISGTAVLRIVRGIEYEAEELSIAMRADAAQEITARLRRWSHMAADGWYSGDVHVHLHYGGDLLLTPDDAALAQRAEDVHLLNMMVANENSGHVHDAGHFTGADHSLSSPRHILRWGEEYRNNLYGHMCMVGIAKLVPPIYSGFRHSEHSHDLPANATAAEACRDAGGTLSYAHPLFDSGDLDRVFGDAHHRSVEAKELPVDAALGLVDAVDLMSYPGHLGETARLWYRLLNCGVRLAATAGTDTFMNVTDSAELPPMGGSHLSNPPAGNRVFARIDGDAGGAAPLTTAAWCDAVRAGRTFVTNGPMLRLEVAGHQPGDEIPARSGDVLRIVAEAGAAVPMQRIELLVNGEVVASATASEDGRHAMVSYELRVEGSCWIAARATGGSHDLVLNQRGGVFAHTSPVYVSVANAPVAVREDAAYFVDWIDRLIALTARTGRFPSPADRDRVLEIFRRAQQLYVERVSV